MHENPTVTRFPPQLPVKKVAIAAQALIDLLDALGGNPDIEDATGAEDEHIQQCITEKDGPGCEIADAGEFAWPEWHTRGRSKDLPRGSQRHEDSEDDDPAEEDDGGGDVVTEDEPAFDPISRAIANIMGADGPGGGSLLDSDYGADGC